MNKYQEDLIRSHYALLADRAVFELKVRPVMDAMAELTAELRKYNDGRKSRDYALPNKYLSKQKRDL